VPERAEAAFPPDGRLPVAELDAQRAELAASPGFAPGEDLEEAIAAYEASVEAADADRALTPEEPATANAASVEAPTLTNDEVAAGVPPTVEPEPVGPAILEAASPETVSDATSGAPTQTVPVERPPVVAAPPAPRVDVVAQPVWTTTPPPESPAGPETPRPAPSAPAQPAPPAATNAAPQWPTGPRWPTAIPARGAPPAPEPVDSLAALIARPSTEALWAASSREILQPAAAAQAPAVQPCISCGISLSATARFCRRCGTPQQA
jgi:ribosomal protein L40E